VIAMLVGPFHIHKSVSYFS